MTFKTISEVRSKAKLLSELGETRVILESRQPDYPWAEATSYKPGSTYRFDCCVSGWFECRDKKSGLNIEWSFDLEDQEASGSGTFRFNVKEIERISALLPDPVKGQFAAHIKSCALKVKAKADEWQKAATAQYQAASALEGVSI